MKLVIGGTQFGMNYGFNNKKKIIKKEVKIIENLIAKYKISHIDTAPSYGNSEAVIGKSKLNKLNIITKIKLDNIKVNNKLLLEKEIYSSIYNSQYKQTRSVFNFFPVTQILNRTIYARSCVLEWRVRMAPTESTE